MHSWHAGEVKGDEASVMYSPCQQKKIRVDTSCVGVRYMAYHVYPRLEGSSRGGLSASSAARMCSPALLGSPLVSLLGKLAIHLGTCITPIRRDDSEASHYRVDRAARPNKDLQRGLPKCNSSGLKKPRQCVNTLYSTVNAPAIEYLVPDGLYCVLSLNPQLGLEGKVVWPKQPPSPPSYCACRLLP